MLFLRVEALLKLEMVCWKSRKHSVKLDLILQNRFCSQVLVSYSVCFPPRSGRWGGGGGVSCFNLLSYSHI